MPSNPWAGLYNNRNAALSGRTGGTTLPSAGAVPYGDLAGILNTFMNQQAVAPLNQNLPGYGANLAQQSANTGSMLRGEVAPDVIRLLQQQGAERGVATGSPGSSNANASWLQALGLTSMGLQQQGNQAFSQQQSDLRVPELWNPASLFVPEHLANQELMAAQGGGGGSSTSAPMNYHTSGITGTVIPGTAGYSGGGGYGRAGW